MECKYKKHRSWFDGERHVETCHNEWEHAYQAVVKELDEIKDILESLVDIQNGTPLIRDADKWNEIMDKAYKALGR